MSRFFGRAKDAGSKEQLEYALEAYEQKIKKITEGNFNCDQIQLAKYDTLYSIKDLENETSCLTTEEMQELIDLKNIEHQRIRENPTSSWLLRFLNKQFWKSENTQRLKDYSGMIVNGSTLEIVKREQYLNKMFEVDQKLGLVEPYNMQKYEQNYAQTPDINLNMALYQKELKAIDRLTQKSEHPPSELTEHFLRQWALNKMLYRGRKEETRETCLTVQQIDELITCEQIFGKQVQADKLRKDRNEISQNKVSWNLELTKELLLEAKQINEERENSVSNEKNTESLKTWLNSTSTKKAPEQNAHIAINPPEHDSKEI